LKKSTLKDYFPLPFIDQVLDTLDGKKYFSFLDGFNGYNQMQIAPEDQDKTTFTCPWGTFSYRVLPFALCNASTTFQRVVLAIFADLECVEIYMDDFSVFGDSFQEALKNLEKVFLHCQEYHLDLSDKNCILMCKARLVLGHLISDQGIQTDTTKIEIILSFPIPKTQREVRGFLGHAGYYRRFIKNFSRITTLLFQLLAKDSEFSWSIACRQSFETLKEKLV